MGGYHKLKQHIIRTKAMHVNCYCYYYDDCLKNGPLWFYLLRLFQHKDRIIYPTPFFQFSIVWKRTIIIEKPNIFQLHFHFTKYSFHITIGGMKLFLIWIWVFLTLPTV